MELINLMPMLIFHRRIPVFPDLSSTADYTGWYSDFTVPGRVNEFHTNFPPKFSIFSLYKFF